MPPSGVSIRFLGTLAVLYPAIGAATEGTVSREPIAGLYRYDAAAASPANPTGANAAAADPTSAARPRRRLADPALRIPEAIPGAVEPAPTNPPPTLVLPKMVVPGPREKPPPPLPQLHVTTPVRNLPATPFESRSARSARLVNKYYTPAEQLLGRLLFNPVRRWAARDEAIAAAAEQLNDIARLIELSRAAGLETPGEQKEIRAEYFRALAERPR